MGVGDYFHTRALRSSARDEPLLMSASPGLIGRPVSSSRHRVPAPAAHWRSDATGRLSESSSETTLSGSQSDDEKSIDEKPLITLQTKPIQHVLSLPATTTTKAPPAPLLLPIRTTSPRASLPSTPSSKLSAELTAVPACGPRPADSRTMHQTSSKLLRMTADERPFTRDIKDLFATLVVSLPLTPHRVRFSRIDHTFTTEEAIVNLGSLKFSQSNRMPDPRDPSRIVTTTTTTTFTMAKEMARAVCMRFLEARYVESIEGKTDFTSARSVWQLTPKGMHILSRFCQRNGIHQRHVNELLDSPRNTMQLVILERDPRDDRLVHDAAMINVLFRRFAGDTGPNLKSSSTSSDSDSVQDYTTGLIGVRMQRARRPDKDAAPYTFTGKAAFDWLMECCSVVNREEVNELAASFMTHGLIEYVGEERGSTHAVGDRDRLRFRPSKHALYVISQVGMEVAGWVTNSSGLVDPEATSTARAPVGSSRDTNTNRMTVIVRDPALRMLFREYLRETHCEENLAFYTEVQAFLTDYELAKRGDPTNATDAIRETLASAYSLYNAFLAPGSPCELNIDHNLRNALAARMTRAVGEDEQMLASLDEVASLFDKAQTSVFKLMASDSIPKFSREPRYATVLKERNLEGMMNSLTIHA